MLVYGEVVADSGVAEDVADEIAPFSERLQAAYDREQHLLDQPLPSTGGATWKMVEGTNNVIEEFFPEAAEGLPPTGETSPQRKSERCAREGNL